MPFARGPILGYTGLGKYTTIGQSEYVGETDVIHIPDGFVTDLATVPRLFWALLPPQGAYERAAVLHDWHCTRLAAGDCPVSSRDADGLFRRVMRESGVGVLTRWLMWTGVRWGALVNPARRADWHRDAPAVIGITTAALAATTVTVRAFHRLTHRLL